MLQLDPSRPDTMNKPTVSQKALKQQLRKANEATSSSKTKKRDDTFSQSRDTHEDRGTRQMKTTHKVQTFPHAV